MAGVSNETESPCRLRSGHERRAFPILVRGQPDRAVPAICVSIQRLSLRPPCEEEVSNVVLLAVRQAGDRARRGDRRTPAHWAALRAMQTVRPRAGVRAANRA